MTKDDVRERTDIVELVREYVPNLKQKGRGHWACCPFHQEKTASFQVNPERQIFHCFGCGVGGDVFEFLRKIEGLSFPEALAKLAERAGVRLEPARRELSQKEGDRLKVRKALESAREYYHGLLKKLPEAEAARRYLARRGLDSGTIERFRLGYAPRAGGLLAAAARKGYTPELLKKAGLVTERQGRVRDCFWARVMFPILNARGETVGFGGRVLGDGKPKYVNSPDTAVFSKGKVLYGLYEALPEMRKAREAVLLEGYTDVLASRQFGVCNACAPLGTALTEDHAVLLKRHVDKVTIVFDPDAAGAAAAIRGAETTLGKGLMVAVASLPDGLDPDELLHKRGVSAFREALAAAEDLPAFQTRLLLKGAKRPLTPEMKSRVAARVLETIRGCADEVLKSEWVRQLADRLAVDEASVRAQLSKGRAASSPGQGRGRRPAPAAPRQRPLPADDRELLACLLRAPALAMADERTASARDALIAEADFSDERAGRVFAVLRKALAGEADSRDRTAWANRLLADLEPEEAGLVRELLCDEREMREPEKIVAEIVGRVRRRRRLAEIEPLVRSGKADAETLQEYRKLFSDLKGMRKGA